METLILMTIFFVLIHALASRVELPGGSEKELRS